MIPAGMIRSMIDCFNVIPTRRLAYNLIDGHFIRLEIVIEHSVDLLHINIYYETHCSGVISSVN